MRILIAPNAFKNSLEAADVASAIKEGLGRSSLQCELQCFPVGDGGDGTGKLLIDHFGGDIVHCKVKDPLGRELSSSFGLIDKSKTAVIEMANASGLRLLRRDELNPLHASSFGTGQLMLAALDKGVSKIILCIGGSATVDGGVGILQALGFQFLDKNRQSIRTMPKELVDLASIDASAVDKRIKHCECVVLCDVENYLLGNQGAAAVFGPQKGANAEDVKQLEAALARLRDVILEQTGEDMGAIKRGGAAGGIAAGLAVLLGGRLVSGIDYFLSITNFDRALADVDAVITGEGSVDQQTLEGKAPYGVARRAKEKGIPVIALAGKVPKEISTPLNKYFDVLVSINNEPMSLSAALASTKENLVRTAMLLGDLLSLKK